MPVIGAFPIAKLGALLLKQISKPIANVVKEQAKSSPIFRKYVCLPPAHLYNWCEDKAKRWILHLGKPVTIPVYNEKMAIELGANLLGEGIIFITAAGVLILEYARSSRKEFQKEEAKKKELLELHMSIKELFLQTEEQGAYIRELRRKVGDLDTRLGTKLENNSSKNKPRSPPSNKTIEPTNNLINNGTVSINDGKSIQNTILQSPILLTDRHDLDHPPYRSFIMKRVVEIENEFWKYPPSERKPGILTNALNYLYKDVYRIDLRMI